MLIENIIEIKEFLIKTENWIFNIRKDNVEVWFYLLSVCDIPFS